MLSKGEEFSLLLDRKLHLAKNRKFSCIWCYLISPKHKYLYLFRDKKTILKLIFKFYKIAFSFLITIMVGMQHRK